MKSGVWSVSLSDSERKELAERKTECFVGYKTKLIMSFINETSDVRLNKHPFPNVDSNSTYKKIVYRRERERERERERATSTIPTFSQQFADYEHFSPNICSIVGEKRNVAVTSVAATTMNVIAPLVMITVARLFFFFSFALSLVSDMNYEL